MNHWEYSIKVTSCFKKDIKKIKKRGLKKEKLEKLVDCILKRDILNECYKDHVLFDTKEYKNTRECHIEPDWLLIYYLDDKNRVLVLVRTGSHSDLFE
jgi:mRNA interferase YafQ